MISAPSSTASGSPAPSDNLQIFIKPVTGETISLSVPPTATVDNIRALLSLQTHKPASSFKLIYGGKAITSYESTLKSLDIANESTISIAKPLRGGMPKKLRCGAKDCREQAQRIVGDCGFCNGHFCGKHRLLEDHKCTGLEDVSAPPLSPASEASASTSDLSIMEIESLDVGMTTLIAGESESDTISGAESTEEVASRISVLEGLKKVAGGQLEWWLAGIDLNDLMDLDDPSS